MEDNSIQDTNTEHDHDDRHTLVIDGEEYSVGSMLDAEALFATSTGSVLTAMIKSVGTTKSAIETLRSSLAENDALPEDKRQKVGWKRTLEMLMDLLYEPAAHAAAVLEAIEERAEENAKLRMAEDDEDDDDNWYDEDEDES